MLSYFNPRLAVMHFLIFPSHRKKHRAAKKNFRAAEKFFRAAEIFFLGTLKNPVGCGRKENKKGKQFVTVLLPFSDMSVSVNI